MSITKPQSPAAEIRQLSADHPIKRKEDAIVRYCLRGLTRRDRNDRGTVKLKSRDGGFVGIVNSRAEKYVGE